MKKYLSLCVLGVFFVSLVISPAIGQTVDEIREKMIEAQGGKKLFESIKDMTLSGSIELVQQGLSGSVTLYKKEPDKRRADFEVMGMVITQAYDGKTAWAVNPQTGSTEEMPEQQAQSMKRQAMAIVAIVYPEKYGLSFALKGKEKIDEKDCFVLEETYPDGFKVLNYVDPETYFIIKTKSNSVNDFGVEVESEQFMSDFKKVNGMMIGHSIVQYQDGEEYLKVVFTEVNFNTGLEDSLFKMNE